MTGVSPEDIHSGRRHEPVVNARRLAWFACIYCSDMTYEEVGRAFGRHHSTIIHGVRTALSFALIYGDKLEELAAVVQATADQMEAGGQFVGIFPERLDTLH